MTAVVHVGDVFDVLPTLDAGSVNCVVTSPPSDADAVELLRGEPQAVALGDVLVGVGEVRNLPRRPIPVREVAIADDLRLVLGRSGLQLAERETMSAAPRFTRRYGSTVRRIVSADASEAWKQNSGRPFVALACSL